MIHYPGHVLADLLMRPAIMGVVNVTPDSFSDGGQFNDPQKGIDHGLRLLDEGADILDIGGESTRPGADPVTPEEEIARVIPVIRGLKSHVKWISIDTRHAKTMRAAIDAGATMINDISGLTHDRGSITVASEAQVPVFLMHSQGVPQDMQDNPNYNNAVDDIYQFLNAQIRNCETHRIYENNLIIDPGIGFGKTLEHNLLILRNIKKFHDLKVPILLGTSRKSFISKICSLTEARDAGFEPNPPSEPSQRIGGSLSSVLHGLQNGVQMFRVHDVMQTRQAFDVWKAIQGQEGIQTI
jgi:dihydropteroate synthase